MNSFSPIEEIFEELRAGRMVILVDDARRENEGDLTMAAEFITPDAVNFMLRDARGLICVPMPPERAAHLGLTMQTAENTSALGTGFTVTVDSRIGTTTGVSAADRAHTIRALADDNTRPEDLARPGHVFPLRARKGGSLVRAGQTEGSVDLCRMAGLKPVAVICEIMNEDGTMARVPQLEEFCKKHQIKMCSTADVIRYRRLKERLVELRVTCRLPTFWGDFTCHLYGTTVDDDLHLALCKGDIGPIGGKPARIHDEPVLVRVHSECLTGDTLGSLRCDCGGQLHQAMQMVEQAGQGVVLYMHQEGRGIGLENKLRAYTLQEQGMDTVQANEYLGFDADERDYGIGSQILADLGLRKLRLITNNPRKYRALSAYGLEIAERVPIVMQSNPENERYLDTKRQKLGHLI